MVKFQYRHEDSPAALASNWWRVLLVDALLCLLAIAAGVASLVAWNEVVGWLLLVLGLLYAFALVGRYRSWRIAREFHETRDT